MRQRGENPKGERGSHIIFRLSRALHSRGRLPDRELYSSSLVRVCRAAETIEPRYQLDTNGNPHAQTESMEPSHIMALLPLGPKRSSPDALEAPSIASRG